MEISSDENLPHVQIKFFTKQERYAVPDTPFSVVESVGVTELSSLINSLQTDSTVRVSFDFLVNGEFLRTTLKEHITTKSISTEAVIEIEYVEKEPAPEPEDSLQHNDWVASVHAYADYILTGCYDNTLRIWNTEGECQVIIPGHIEPIKCVHWLGTEEDSPIKEFVSGSHDQTLLLWEWNRNNNSVKCVNICRGHAGSVDCIATQPQGTKFCSGSYDKMLKIWDKASTPEEEGLDQVDATGASTSKRRKTEALSKTKVPIMTLSGHKENISSVQWSGPSEVLTAGFDMTIRLWDLATGSEKSCLTGTKAIFDTSYSSSNGMLLAGCSDRHVRLYDPRSKEGAVVKSAFSSHHAWVSSVAWCPASDHLFISGSYDNLVKQWDTRSPTAPLYDLTGHEDRVLCVDWSMPQYMLSGAADNTLKIFKASQFHGQRT